MVLHVREAIIHCCFLDMHAENSWGCANERDDFLQRELGRAAMDIAYSANYEQCLVPLEHCCFDAALLYGIRSRHANA